MNDEKFFLEAGKKTEYLLHPKNAVKSLRFEGDKIEFYNRTAKVTAEYSVKEFMEQFDKLVFVDPDGKEVTFEKKEEDSVK